MKPRVLTVHSTLSRPPAKRTREVLYFSNSKDFRHFVKHLDVLAATAVFRPSSLYELAGQIGMNVANLTKLMRFYEKFGAVRLVPGTVRGRTVRTPMLEFDRVEVNLLFEGARRVKSGRRMLRLARTR